MLHLHFEYLERTHDGYLLTDEHEQMLKTIRDLDAEHADALAHAQTRRFRDSFIDLVTKAYSQGVALPQTAL